MKYFINVAFPGVGRLFLVFPAKENRKIRGAQALDNMPASKQIALAGLLLGGAGVLVVVLVILVIIGVALYFVFGKQNKKWR